MTMKFKREHFGNLTKLLGVLPLLTLALAAPVAAQDDCPAGHVRNPQVSPLDHDYMLSAFKATFRGLFGRDPSMQPGSGKDDGEYYISASNHYGVYGDDQCHAGWSGYWESWLQNGHGDLTLVQTPAHFLPGVPPPPVVTPPPAPVPPPVVQPPAPIFDTSALQAQIAALRADVDAGRTENQQFFEESRAQWKNVLLFVAKWGPIVSGSMFAGHQIFK